MDRQDISDTFYSLVAPSHPNDWELEEVVEYLATLSDRSCQQLLNHIPAIWPISNSLCYGYLRYGSAQINHLGASLLPEWIRQILATYEKGGLRQAETFMADIQKNFLCRQESSSEVALASVNASMTHYIRGVSASSLRLDEDTAVWTDTETIYLPSQLDIFSTKDQNRLLYKFLVTYQWVITKLGIFALFSGQDPAAGRLKTLVKETENAELLLRVYLLIKGSLHIQENLPGLWHRCSPLLQSQFEFGRIPSSLPTKSHSIDHLLVRVWGVEGRPWFDDEGVSVESGLDVEECLAFIKQRLGVGAGNLTQVQQYILGALNLSRAEMVLRERREREKKAFVTMLARLVPAQKTGRNPDGVLAENVQAGQKQELEGSVAILSEFTRKMLSQGGKKTLQIDNANVTVPDELVRLAAQISTDMGAIPTGYIQAAAGLAGQGLTAEGPMLTGNDSMQQAGNGQYIYDEWDCRRRGYRRDWCTIIEEELPVTKSNFIPRTLQKYGGLRKRLRAQFELMQTTHRFVRRQRDGDDLDLDAITDAIGDQVAGKTVSERLFIRLLRDDRSITTLFLIDMSNSTSGWISTFIKESLVLLCEAMEKVGDSYGIYGFSGMKRSRCKMYHIKEVGEPYDEAVRERISAIGPKDYTRMAPAIRHLTSLLEKSDTKTRLLISLSDGKPEDYDGYNGEYAIEDTRKALLEARGKGVSPFCITIDKQAHDYLEHMYGTGNYMFINRIESLPAKMAQIYRMLTR
ncbi:nitric oxide reductase activation protein NorD [Desulfopila sp. IMCC35008]|uniref:nitric oxide reductase activation protein NorD n=1 Tax=Desulfopila sp. IMCC35008 TaxID=2653858 RepID=UPI0013D5730C|nr:VWA domain-containing protein [Desulfopila sp. IMCC35008]